MAGAEGKSKKRGLIAGGIILFAVILALVLYFTGAFEAVFLKLGFLQETEVSPKGTYFEYVPKGTADMCVLEDRILIADESGISCFDQDGTWLWSKELSLSAPVFVAAGDRVLAADIGGNGVHCFDKNGFLWTSITEDRITGVSDNCVRDRFLVLHRSAGYLSAATLLNVAEEGVPLASRKFGESYAVSASFSEDGAQAAVAGISPDGGAIATGITFLRTEGCEVFSTETVSGEFLPLLSYVKGISLFAAGGDSLHRIVKQSAADASADSNTILWKREGEAKSVVAAACVRGKYYVTVSTAAGADKNMEASCEVSLYGPDGTPERSFSAEGGIIGVRMKGKTLALYTENELYVYNISGQRIGKFESVSQITDVEFLSERQLVLCGASKMAKADFRP